MLKQPIDLALALDFGGSLTKMIGGISQEKWCASSMNPEVITVAEMMVKQQVFSCNSQPKDHAWIGVNNQYYAVGYLATTKFLANSGLRKLKTDNAMYKVLAAIWIMQQKFQLPPALKVHLACFLPPREYQQTGEQLLAQLRQALSHFETPTGMLQVELVNLDIIPEGGGIMMQFDQKYRSVVENNTVALLMVGYRNTSLLIFQRGNFGSCLTSNHGFSQMVRAVTLSVDGATESNYTEAIVKAGDDLKAQYLLPLLPMVSPDNQAPLLAQLRQKISLARDTYLHSLRSWLEEVLPPSVYPIICCGGTVEYLKKDLEQILKNYSLVFHGGIVLPESLRIFDCPSRFVDVWGLWCFLQERAFPSGNSDSNSNSNTTVSLPQKRGRGRPRKELKVEVGK